MKVSDWGSPKREKTLLFVSVEDKTLSVLTQREVERLCRCTSQSKLISLFNSTSLVRLLSIGAALGAEKEWDVLWS